MKKISNFLIPVLKFPVVVILAVLPGFAVASNTTGTVSGTIDFDIPQWFKQSFLEIAEDAGEAAETNKHLLLFFHLDNCPYCARMLRDNFNSGENSTYIQTHFDAIDINIKGDRQVEFDSATILSEKALAEHLKVLYTPTIIFVNSANQAVLRVDGFRNPERFRIALAYVHEKAYLTSTFTEFTAKRLKRAQYNFRKHSSFTFTSDFEKAARQPLAVIFEDANCEDCNEIHTTLFNRDDVKAAFSELTVVRVDALSDETIVDPTGASRTLKDWVTELNLTYRPSVVLFDKNREIARIDNRLYSWHFNGFVTWVAGRHYEDYPDVYRYMAQRRKEHLAAGKNVSYVD